jgi:hypothetical protein
MFLDSCAIWIGFSAFMIYEFVFNTSIISDSSTFVISCKQSILLRYVCSQRCSWKILVDLMNRNLEVLWTSLPKGIRTSLI